MKNKLLFESYYNWYDESLDIIYNKYKEDYKLYFSLLASTSPRKFVTNNVKVTNKLFNDKDKDLIKYIGNKPIEFKKQYNLMQCHLNNVKNSLLGLDLSGPKVHSFYNNLIGNLDLVTIDVWMLKYYNYKNNLNKTSYNLLSKRVIRASKKTQYKPAQLQAILWTQVRYNHGFKPVRLSQFLVNNQLNLFS